MNFYIGETPVLWPPHAKSWFIGKDWSWEGLGAGGEGDDRGWDGWMASLTQWMWVWVDSGSWWWTGSPGVLWFMGSQRVRHDWATELNWKPKFIPQLVLWGIVILYKAMKALVKDSMHLLSQLLPLMGKSSVLGYVWLLQLICRNSTTDKIFIQPIIVW